MKKILALILALILCFAMSAAAYAGTGSVSAPDKDPAKTADAPEVVEGNLEITPLKDVADLTVEQQDEFLEAQEQLEDVVPEEMTVRYFVYVEADLYPATAVLKMEDFTEVSAKLFTDGEWKDVEVKVLEDGTVSLEIPGPGALAIFTK